MEENQMKATLLKGTFAYIVLAIIFIIGIGHLDHVHAADKFPREPGRSLRRLWASVLPRMLFTRYRSVPGPRLFGTHQLPNW
jgi:hypothetical protein